MNIKFNKVSNQSWIRHAFFIAALLTGFFLFTFHITSDLYGDEYGHTYKLVNDTDFWSAIIKDIIIHPPLYFILAKFARDLFGMDWAIRIPSLIFALGTIFLLPYLANHVLEKQCFLISAWLTTLSPFLLEFASEGRPYAMLIFFSTALVWSFLNFLKKEDFKNMLIMAVIAIFGALTHYFFLLQLFVIGIYYLFSKRHISRYAFGFFAIVVIVLAPLFIYLIGVPQSQYAGYVQDSWALTYFSVPNFLARLLMALNFGYNTFQLPNLDSARNISLKILIDNWVFVLLILISFSGILYALVKMALCKKKWFWFFILGMMIPVIIGVFLGISGRNLLREKHLAVIWIYNLFLILFAFKYLIKTKVGWIFIACYISVVFVSNYHYLVYPNEYSRRMDWTGLNHTLEQKIITSDIIILYRENLKSLSLGKMKILNSNIRQINLQTDSPQEAPFSIFLENISRSTDGTIYLINHEEQRLMTDPQSEVTNTLKKLRSYTEERFGRNLILYTFRSKVQ